MITRPYRSVLYIPASNARAMEKARTLSADAIIFDLEDAVTPAEKLPARELLAHALLAGNDPALIVGGVVGDWIKGPLMPPLWRRCARK